MLAVLSLIGGLRGILVGIAGAGAMFGLLTAYHATFVHPSLVRAAVAEGTRVERARWEEAQRLIRIEAERRLAAAQTKIDAAEQAYLAEQSKATALSLALEEAIQAEQESDDAVNPSCPARPAISRRLRDKLQPIGR